MGKGIGCLCAFFFIAIIVSCAGASSKRNESAAWDAQMRKDPATWTIAEEQRYNGYIEWLDEN